jgi:flagellar basal-body rod protein FlgB
MSVPVSSIFSGPAFQALKQSLKATEIRHSALASNIANINTPGYKRLDLSSNFQAALEQSLKKIQEGEIPPPILGQPIGVDSQAGPGRLDGNNVRMDRELVELMKNDAHFEFASRLLAKSYGGIKMAITGKSGA